MLTIIRRRSAHSWEARAWQRLSTHPTSPGNTSLRQRPRASARLPRREDAPRPGAMKLTQAPVADAPMFPSVSVVIPTRGRPDLVTRAIQSALSQTRPPHEIVVVIDGPDQDTLRAIADLRESRVRVLELPTNGGASAARNAGIRASVSDLIAFLDDDDEWLPTKLEVQVAHWVAHPKRSQLVLGSVVEWRSGTTTNIWP